MPKRDLSLTPRKEELRDAKLVVIPAQFSLNEIKQHFKDSLDTITKQYMVADTLNENGDIDGCKMIWRSQVVLAEGLLDFYIHEMSKYCLFRMFTRAWFPSEKYASFTVPMEKVEEALSAAQSKDWFFSYLNNRFSRDVFLSCESMRDQLNLIGIDFAPTMVKAFPRNKEADSIKDGKKLLRNYSKGAISLPIRMIEVMLQQSKMILRKNLLRNTYRMLNLLLMLSIH